LFNLRGEVHTGMNLLNSHDSLELKRAAIVLASSESLDHHSVLASALGASQFLNTLDALESFSGTADDLQLASVMQALIDNRTPSIDEIILGLINNADFQNHQLRVKLTIRTLTAVKPSPDEAIQYWLLHCEQNDPLMTDVVEALCVNQSSPAMDLLMSMLKGSAHDIQTKTDWLRESYLPRRYDEPLLEVCKTIVNANNIAGLTAAILEAQFDYQPDYWYWDSEPPEPPSMLLASTYAQQCAIDMGRFGLSHAKLNERLKTIVESNVRTLESEIR